MLEFTDTTDSQSSVLEQALKYCQQYTKPQVKSEVLYETDTLAGGERWSGFIFQAASNSRVISVFDGGVIGVVVRSLPFNHNVLGSDPGATVLTARSWVQTLEPLFQPQRPGFKPWSHCSNHKVLGSNPGASVPTTRSWVQILAQPSIKYLCDLFAKADSAFHLTRSVKWVPASTGG